MTICFAFDFSCLPLFRETIDRGVLDELEQCAFDDSVEENNRLLILEAPDGIDMARTSLSFG